MTQKTQQEALDDLRIAWLDFAYALLSPTVIRFAEWRGWTLKPWVLQARQRAAQR